MLNPRGGGQTWGAFLKTKCQIPHPGDNIFGQKYQNSPPSLGCMPQIGSNFPHPGGTTYDQNPHPEDKPHSQIPVGSPTPTPPPHPRSGLNTA